MSKPLLSDGRGGSLLPAALPLLLCHGSLLVLYDLGRWPWLTVGLLACCFTAFAVAARRLDGLSVPLPGLLLVAACTRILLLPLPPTLSDDVLRYVWDGRVASAGFNPYLLPPEAEELGELRDDRWRHMPHKEVPTVYPPLALFFFAVASQAPSPIFGWKILLCFADLLGCGLLAILARRLGRPTGVAIWYCWNPLVSLETAAMGHVDALMVAAMVAAVLALSSRPPRVAWGGVAAALGVLSKLVPLIALPLWARSSGRGGLFLLAAGAVLVAVLAPVLVTTGVPPGLVTYGVSWEWNGPLYEPAWRLLDAAEVDRHVKAGIDWLKGLTGHHDSWNRLYPFVYPQLLAKLLLAGAFGLFFLRQLVRRDPPVVQSGRLFGALLLCTATVYPWYLLWVLPWAALCRHRAWLALSASMVLAYLPQHVHGLELFPWFYLLIWLPFALLLLRGGSWDVELPVRAP